MKARDLFGVIVRVMGLALIVYGLKIAVPAFFLTIGGGASRGIEILFGATLPPLLLGFVFFFSADSIIRLAYRDSRD